MPRVTVAEYSRNLKCDPKTVRTLIDQGKLTPPAVINIGTAGEKEYRIDVALADDELAKKNWHGPKTAPARATRKGPRSSYKPKIVSLRS